VEEEPERSNVIQFPRDSTWCEPLTLEEIRPSIEAIRYTHVECCLEAVADVIVSSLAAARFMVDEDPFAKDMALVYTALRSAMMKAKGLRHPFQGIADKLFTCHEDGEITINLDLDTDPEKMDVKVAKENGN
jgi:hypothetical protein